jgi:hypothetical protein
MPDISATDSRKQQPAGTMATPTSTPPAANTNSDGNTDSLNKFPAEIRNEIYRHYFSDIGSLKRSTTRPVWSKAEAESVALLQTSKQIRHEAAPIFYEECFGNHDPNNAHSWVFTASDPKQWVLRLKAVSQMSAQTNPDVGVSIRLTQGVIFLRSGVAFAKVLHLLGLETTSLFDGLQLANVLSDYLRRQLSYCEYERREVKGEPTQLCGFTVTTGEFVVVYSYSPTRKEERLGLKGPVAKVAWSGLQF